jgi:serine/threonine protein kinase
VTELCEAGDLAKWLKRHRELSEPDAKIIMKKIIDAITYLHKNSKFID